MKLSEAIRLGAMLHPQGTLFFFADGKSCAFGAALEATGTAYGDANGAQLKIALQWPWTLTTIARCPVCQEGALIGIGMFRLQCFPQPGPEPTMRFTVAHLNNDHHWTRERIADFVATFEPAPPADAVGLSTVPVLIDTAR